jgi:hypothetical protein
MLRIVKYGLLSLLAVACGSEEPSAPQLDPAPLPPRGKSVGVDATVEFVKIEGGCWALRTAEGYYEPVGLPLALRTNGQQVKVWISQTGDMASLCQIAPIVRVDSAVAVP